MNSKDICCKFCSSNQLSPIIDFGEVALAGGFLKPELFAEEKKYPLQLYFCNDCYLLQIVNKVSSEVLFKNYFYYSSAIATLREHFKRYAHEVTQRFLNPESATVVEFGCNDGVLLNPLSDMGIKTVIGVDPASNIIKAINNSNISVVNDFFSEKTARNIAGDFGRADLIAANNVFAHIEDMHDVMHGIKILLKDDGVFVFEVHYLGNIIETLQYDMIYHEHLYYYSLIALEKFFGQYDMEIFDVKKIPIHAGSMRYYVRNKGHLKKESMTQNVIDLRREELQKQYDRVETYLDYAHKVEKTEITLMNLLKQLKEKNNTVWGYGASGRANTIIQYCKIDTNMMDYIIDDAPAKHGFYTPGSHFPIISRDVLEKQSPDYVLVFAWSFFKEILGKTMNYIKNGGKFIIPLPEVKVVSFVNGNVVEELFIEKL